ncbi:MAG: PstS family phosphate ABC transporter substrate-binding protein [Alphaproteobacteria bacterium]
MIGKTAVLAALAIIVTAGTAAAQQSRDHIRIVGSSTVYPFSTAVAEQFGKATKFKTPVVESTGSGGGIKLFCAGVGTEHPDIANSSRRMKKSEFDICTKNGVTDITEVQIGFDGIVLGNSRNAPPATFTRLQVYRALARQVVVNGRLVANPARTWKDVDPALPAIKIEVLGPPPTSGTRDAFVELVMDAVCETQPEIALLRKTDDKAARSACQSIREDGAYVEAGENDNLIVQKLNTNKDTIGIFGYSYLDQNGDKIQGATVDGQAPTFENIASGKYAVSRPLFFYVKKAHVGVVPGITDYVSEFTSEKAWGKEGYLSDKGLIPLHDADRKAERDKAKAMTKLAL